MTITTKTTKAELVDLLNDAEERALASYHELLEVKGKLNAEVEKWVSAYNIAASQAMDNGAEPTRVNQMGDRKLYKLVLLSLAAGMALGAVLALWVA